MKGRLQYVVDFNMHEERLNMTNKIVKHKNIHYMISLKTGNMQYYI